MKTMKIIGIIIGVLMLSNSALAFESRKGLEIEARLGPNVCVDREASECDNEFGELKAGFGGGGYLGIRPLPFLSFGLDLGVYSFTPEPDTSSLEVRTTQAMVDFRLYIPFNFIEPFVKLGVGYASFTQTWQADGEEEMYRAYGFANFKFGGGLTLYIIDSDKIGNLGLGADFDLVFLNPSKEKECLGDSCETEDFEEEIVPNAMQFNLHFKWIFPLF